MKNGDFPLQNVSLREGSPFWQKFPAEKSRLFHARALKIHLVQPSLKMDKRVDLSKEKPYLAGKVYIYNL